MDRIRLRPASPPPLVRPVVVVSMLASSWVAGPAAPAAAQLLPVQAVDPFGAAAAPDGTALDVTPGFVVPTDSELNTAVADFRRYVDKRAWVKAFQTIGDLPEGKLTGMLPGKDGFIVPARQRIWEVLTELPPEGREAYRVFFDAKAEQLMTLARGRGAANEQRIDAAREVFHRYFVTSAGDEAADLLGDALFEQGRFEEAERYWRAVLDHYPDTELSDVKLYVKRAIALLRARQKEPFDDVLQTIRQRFATDRVTLGGRPVEPASFLEQLAASADPVTGTDRGAPPDDGTRPPVAAPPDGAEPVWQCRFLSDRGKKLLDAAQQNHWAMYHGLGSYVPPSVIDGGRLYCNWLGVCFAVDLETGKLIWRTGKFSALGDVFNRFQHTSNVGQYAVAARGNTVLAVTMPLDRLGHHQEPYRLEAFDANSGAQRWCLGDTQSQPRVSFLGQPAFYSDVALTACHQPGAHECELRAVGLADGVTRWKLPLGTCQASGNNWGVSVMPVPVLFVLGDSLYVLTNNGALVVVDLRARRTSWALKFEPPVTTGQERNPWDSANAANALHPRGVILESDGVLYFKEQESRLLFALDPAVREVKWKYPIDAASTLVGADGDSLYLLSREMLAVDRRKPRLRWSIRLPVAAGGLSAVVGSDCLTAFTSRGIYELSGENGDVRRIFRGADLSSLGGRLTLAAGRYVCVSNRAITAYPTAAATKQR